MNMCIQKRSDELASSSREQADSANGVGNNASEPRGSGITPLISAAHNATAYGDEFDTTIITFNTVCSFVSIT
jgi:CCR4-NOT transcription complex subunit 10